MRGSVKGRVRDRGRGGGASRALEARSAAREVARRRPAPPPAVCEVAPELFVPTPELATFARETFLVPGAPLHNPDHLHLEHARIGYLWTNVPNRRSMRWVLGTAEIPQTMGGAWKRGRAEQQLREWFGWEPDFLITLFAPELAKASDRSFCAVLEHELYHCAHATTDTGAPRFHDDGSPIYGILGHDVEEFVGVVRRYGRTAAVASLVEAALAAPAVGDMDLAGACGTCRASLRKVA